MPRYLFTTAVTVSPAVGICGAVHIWRGETEAPFTQTLCVWGVVGFGDRAKHRTAPGQHWARPKPWSGGSPCPVRTWGAVGTCCGCACNVSVRVHPAPRPSAFLPPLPRDCFCDLELRCAVERAGGGTGLCGNTAPQCLGMWGDNGIAWSPRSDPSREVFGPRTHGAGTLEAGVTTRGSQNQGAGGRGCPKLGLRRAGGTWAPRPPPLPGSGQPHGRGLVWGAEPRSRPGRDGRTGSPGAGARRCGAGSRRAEGGCGSGLRDFV